MLTDFNDFWHTVSWRNLTLESCKFAHLTWENKIVYKLESTLFPRRKWVAREDPVVLCGKINGSNATESGQSDHPVHGHAPSRFRHWSMASSTTLCCSPAHVSTIVLLKTDFWHSPGTVATVYGWGGQTYDLLMSSSFRIQFAKND